MFCFSGQGEEEWQADDHPADDPSGQHEPEVRRGRHRARRRPQHQAKVSCTFHFLPADNN